MGNTPFRFLDSPALLTELRHALAQVGLLEQETAEQKAGDEEPGRAQSLPSGPHAVRLPVAE